MSLFNIFNVAGSGMSAQNVRLNTTSSNLANADAVSSSLKETYRARHPVFATELQSVMSRTANASSGVKVLGIVENNRNLTSEYSPDHPMADADGFIYKSNVNPVEEMADMISATRAYQLNIDVADSAKRLLMQTLRLGKN